MSPTLRSSIGVLFALGCVVNQPLVPSGTTPEPSPAAAGATTGTLTCAEIFQQCDIHCATPECVEQCQLRGTPEAQRVHAQVVACAKASGCVEQICVMDRCDAEIQACRDHAEPSAALGTVDEAAPAAGEPASTGPAFAGLWSWGSLTKVGSMAGTGWKPAAGPGAALRIDADGRYERSSGAATSQAGCATGTFKWVTGRWTAEGQTIVFREEKTELRHAESCNPQNDSEKLPPPETDSRRFELGTDSATGQATLRLTAADGRAETYFKR